jgi:hypothetical protein
VGAPIVSTLRRRIKFHRARPRRLCYMLARDSLREGGRQMATIGDAVLISAIVAISTAAQLVLTSRAKRKEKDQDYAREDAVAKQAAEAARLLVERQDAMASKAAEAARLLAVNTEAVAKTAQRTSDKLDVIHTLVNSNMTAAMQAELDATVREAAMIQEVMDLKKTSGVDPTVEALAALKSARNKIAELTSTLTDRLKVTTAGK